MAQAKKDMFISAGENIFPVEIEATMADMLGLASYAVLCLPDACWGEAGHVALVCASGVNLVLNDVLAHLDGRIARYKLPRSMSPHEALPRTGSGKVKKAVLRALLLDRIAT